MSVSPVNGVHSLTPVAGTSAVPRITRSASADSSFAEIVSQMVGDTNSKYAEADESLSKLVTGEADNLHEVVIDAAQADLSFRLLVEIRNKLLDAYQEIMRMQV